MGVKWEILDKYPLAAKNNSNNNNNNYATEFVNAYIVYDLNAWPKISPNNFKLKRCFFGATNIKKSGSTVVME